MTTTRLGLASGWGKIHNIRFNADGSLFAVAMVDGLRLYSVSPNVREEVHLFHDRVGSVAHAEMLECDNILAFIPATADPEGANSSRWGPKNVLVMDPFETEENPRVHVPPMYKPLPLPGKIYKKFTTPTEALSVRIREGHMAVVTRNTIYVMEFPGFCKHLFSVSTRDNPRGLCEISPLSASQSRTELMAFPGHKTGSVQLIDLSAHHAGATQSPVTLAAHQSELFCLALNQSSSVVATASAKGTLIRVWDAASRAQLVELRRGTDQALLHCISFSTDDAWLCCSSDKGTVHVFALQDYRLNKRSALATLGMPGAYAGSQWSLASFTVPQECACVCAFGRDEGTVHAVCVDGSFHKYHFTADGKCERVSYDVFTQLSSASKVPRMLASIRKNN